MENTKNEFSIEDFVKEVQNVKGVDELATIVEKYGLEQFSFDRELSNQLLFSSNELVRKYLVKRTLSQSVLERMAKNDPCDDIVLTAEIRMSLKEMEDYLDIDYPMCYKSVSDLSDIDSDELLIRNNVTPPTEQEKLLVDELSKDIMNQNNDTLEKHNIEQLNRRVSELLMFSDEFMIRMFTVMQTTSAYILKSMLYADEDYMIKNIAEMRLMLADIEQNLGVQSNDGYFSVTED